MEYSQKPTYLTTVSHACGSQCKALCQCRNCPSCRADAQVWYFLGVSSAATIIQIYTADWRSVMDSSPPLDRAGALTLVSQTPLRTRGSTSIVRLKSRIPHTYVTYCSLGPSLQRRLARMAGFLSPSHAGATTARDATEAPTENPNETRPLRL